MARTELHSNKLPGVAQRAPLVGNATQAAGDVVTGELIGSVEGTYFADLAMLEEPVTIRLEPSSDKNAAQSLPIWCNGKGAEVWLRDRWVEIVYLPVGVEMILKRKYVGIIVCAKTDTVLTRVQDMEGDRPINVVQRVTSPVMSFSILQDNNPNGAAWVAELRRKQL